MARVEERLTRLGLQLPGVVQVPPDITIPFEWVRVHGDRAFASGHGAISANGTPLGPFGKVPSRVSLEDAQESARAAILAMLASLKQAIGDLDRISAWLMVFGNVNADPGYAQTTLVLNPVSELLIKLFGATVGAHARTAIGMAALPLDYPVIIAAEVQLAA